MQSYPSERATYLHEVQHSRSWDCHICAAVDALGGAAELNSSRSWLGTADAKNADHRCHFSCIARPATLATPKSIPACRRIAVDHSTTTMAATSSTSAAAHTSRRSAPRHTATATAMHDTGTRSSAAMATNNSEVPAVLPLKLNCPNQTCNLGS